MQQGENDPNENSKLRFDNVYKTMDLDGGENFLRSNQLVKVAGKQDSSKETKVQIGEMKKMCFPLSADQKRYILLLNKLKNRDNLGRYEYTVTNT